MRKYMRGITLLELMIVVVIISILTAIAYPNYREYVTRAKRTEAKAALLQIATQQERFYLQNNTYTTDMTNAWLSRCRRFPVRRVTRTSSMSARQTPTTLRQLPRFSLAATKPANV